VGEGGESVAAHTRPDWFQQARLKVPVSKSGSLGLIVAIVLRFGRRLVTWVEPTLSSCSVHVLIEPAHEELRDASAVLFRHHLVAITW
jgi:hypothetical protein